MADTFQMQLCNISSELVNWTITPVGEEPVELDQETKSYGSIEVSFAERYLIIGGNISQTTEDPSAMAIFTGSEVIICTPD